LPSGSLGLVIKKKENVLSGQGINLLQTIDYAFVDSFAASLSKSNFLGSGLTKTKEKLSRAFSMRRQSLSGVSSASLTSLNNTPVSGFDVSFRTPSPSPRRQLTRAVSSFLSFGGGTHGKQLHGSHHLSRRQLSSNNLNELPEESMESPTKDNDGTFSLPTTPAPRKKKCQTKSPDQSQPSLEVTLK
jgi:hypothetical protein